MVTAEKLREHFQTLGCNIEDEIIFNKCFELCSSYRMDEETFVETWVGFSVTRFESIDPTLEALDELEHVELKKLDLTTVNDVSVMDLESEFSENTENDHFLTMYGCNLPTTPKVKRLRSPDVESEKQDGKIRAVDRTFSPSSYIIKPNAPSRYATGIARGKILMRFGDEISTWKRNDEHTVLVKKSDDPHVPSDAVYMCETLCNQGSCYNVVCQDIGEYLCKEWNKIERTGIPYVRDVKAQSNMVFRTWGRISSNARSKSETATVKLEGCKRLKGSRKAPSVYLDLSSIRQYSLFPGQIVAVECTNTTGTTLHIKKLFTKGYAPIAEAPTFRCKLNVVIAAGPFTPSDNLNYQPLWDLMERVAEDEPHVLILIGPFLEYTHPEIQSASIKDTFQELFEKIIEKVMEYVKGKSTQVILIPSNKDAHHDPVYPTPEYVLSKNRIIQGTSNLHLMPDPCTLDIEGLKVGVTSVDSVRHLGSEEITNTSGMDRLSRLADHLLCQNCFYPLYPPALDLNVDPNLWEKYAFFNHQPHLLVLPSDMRHFCKVINECVVLNPERLCKYSYAKLCVRPTVDGKWRSNNVSCEVAKA